MEKSRAYNITVNNYTTGQKVPLQRNCNAYAFTNLGDVIAEVNGIRIFPSTTPATVMGDSVSIGGNEGEIYKGNIDLKFILPTAGTAPNVLIVQKYYIEEYMKDGE